MSLQTSILVTHVVTSIPQAQGMNLVNTTCAEKHTRPTHKIQKCNGLDAEAEAEALEDYTIKECMRIFCDSSLNLLLAYKQKVFLLTLKIQA